MNHGHNHVAIIVQLKSVGLCMNCGDMTLTIFDQTVLHRLREAEQREPKNTFVMLVVFVWFSYRNGNVMSPVTRQGAVQFQ